MDPLPLHGATVVFAGDSITATEGGFASQVADLVTVRHPDAALSFVNAGVPGHTAADLAARWEADVLAAQPDVVVLLIGVNDAYYEIDPAAYEDLCDRLLASVADAHLVVADPFLVLDATTECEPWHRPLAERLPAYRAVCARLAERHGARHVRTQDAFDAQLAHRDGAVFAPEPVHPNRLGHLVIAHAVLRAGGWA